MAGAGAGTPSVSMSLIEPSSTEKSTLVTVAGRAHAALPSLANLSSTVPGDPRTVGTTFRATLSSAARTRTTATMFTVNAKSLISVIASCLQPVLTWWGRAGSGGAAMHLAADAAPICTQRGRPVCRLLLWVALPPVRVLFLSAKHLFFSAKATRRSPSPTPRAHNPGLCRRRLGLFFFALAGERPGAGFGCYGDVRGSYLEGWLPAWRPFFGDNCRSLSGLLRSVVGCLVGGGSGSGDLHPGRPRGR